MTKNNKGFVLTELLIISTVVMGVLIYMFVEFKNINRNYQYSFKYDTIEGMYLANNIINYLSDDCFDKLVDELNKSEEKYLDITSCDISVFATGNYCETLFEKSKIAKILFSKEDLIDLRKNMDSLDEDTKQYINNIKTVNSSNDYRIIIIYQNETYATMRFNKGNTYIQSNLIAHLDGINNTGLGHSSEATTWKDTIGNFDVALSGSPSWTTNSIIFDGINDYGTIANMTSITFPRGLTIESRIKIISNNSLPVNNTITILDNIINTTPEGGLGQYFIAENETFSTKLSARELFTLTTSPIYKEDFVTITTTYDNKYIKLYINGVLYDQKIIASTYTSSSLPITIAKKALNESEYSNIEFQEIRIYDKALTENEILRNYKVDEIRY